jgi:hypothetical protein
MVLWGQSHLQLENGTEAGISSGVYNHHVIMLDFGRKMITGPTLTGPGATTGEDPQTMLSMLPAGVQSGLGKTMPAMSIFVGQGSEGGANSFSAGSASPVKSGFHIQKQDKITLLAELVNYNAVKTPIWLALEYEYLPNRPEGYLDVGQFGIATQNIGADLAAIGFSEYSSQVGTIGIELTSCLEPPKDKAVTYTSPNYPVIADGYLLNVVPHLHDGGIDVKLYVNNQTVCTSNAIYGGAKSAEKTIGAEKWETITSYTLCDKPIQVKKGDILKMSSEYDLTKHKL